MLAIGKNELTAPANSAAKAYAGQPAGSSTQAIPVAPTTRLIVRALTIGLRRSRLAPDSTLARIEITRPTASSAAAWPARSPHSSTANVVRNGIAPYWHTAPTAPITVGRPSTALTGKRSDTGAPEGGPRRSANVATKALAASPAAHQKAIRQLLAAAPRAPSNAAIVNPAEKATP